MPKAVTGSKWAIRITIGTEVESQLSLDNMCAIHHTGGSRSGTFKEKSHYHIWLEFDSDKTYTYVQDLFRQKELLGTVRKTLKNGNSLWSFKPWETTFDDWWKYVWKDDEKDPRVVVWTLPFEQPEIPLGIPIVASPGDAPNIVILKPKKKEPEHLQFYDYVVAQQVPVPVTMESLVRHYVRMREGRFALRYAKPVLQYVWYKYNGCQEQHENYLVEQLMRDLPDF